MGPGRGADRGAGAGIGNRGDDHRQASRLNAAIRVFLDIQALQNPWSAERGIGRHVRELAVGLGRWHPELELTFLTNRDLQIPAAVTDNLQQYGCLSHSDDPSLPQDALLHVPSTFEPVSIDRVWPAGLRRRRLVVTLHDLIPAVFPDEQMPDPAVRRAYWGRIELVRYADRILGVSQATVDDAVRLLGVRPEKLSITGGGVSPDFKPPESRAAAREALRRLRPDIDSDFVLYTGGQDYRKNVGGLLAAYAELSRQLQERYKLVLVGRLGLTDAAGQFAAQAQALGIVERVVFTGFVSEAELVLLYQAASLFVFPSLYEGFGLPVVEALACGAPSLAGRNSSLVELIESEEAFFNPADSSSIRAALERALGDPQLLERLRSPEVGRRFSWRKIAERTAAAYEDVARLRRRAPRSRRRILCVAPLPGAGVDGETTELVLHALADRCDFDLLIDHKAEGRVPEGIEAVSLDGLDRVERLRAGYYGTIYWLGNAPEYALPLALLRRRPGVVAAYNVRLTRPYAWASDERPELGLPAVDILDDEEADRFGIYMATDAIAASTRFFVHFAPSNAIARLEAGPGDAWKVARLPLPLPYLQHTVGGNRVGVFAADGDDAATQRVLGQLAELGVDAALVAGSPPAGLSAGVALRGAPNAPGFTTFIAHCVAGGLPTLLVGLSLGTESGSAFTELEADADDDELRAALASLNRPPQPITREQASASVDAMASRLIAALKSGPDRDASYDSARAQRG